MLNLYFFLGGAMLVFAIIILWITFIIPSIKRRNKYFIVTMFSVFVLTIIFCIIDLLVYKNPNLVLIEKIASYLEYLLLSITIPIFTAYLLNICDENLRKNLLFRAVVVIWIIYLVLLGIAQFTTFLYQITADGLYIRGDFHFVLMTPLILMMFLNLAGVIKRRDKLTGKYFAAFLIHLLPLTVAFLIHTVIYSSVIVLLSECISMLAIFSIILYDQIEDYVGQQREIAHQRANIMVLQMRPHFIHNAMMSIYYLCAQNPQKAQEVTLDFTTYLRKNFNAIAGENPIPFSDELEHTRAYLAIEQVQFEDSLIVEYDTPHKNFRLPPLTLQPIVENAVKHGMDPEYAPLYISIKTRETNLGSEIIVEDNGPGFILDDENFKTNTALDNIRQRLNIMCGGKMIIRPREGGGTVVNVIIPLKVDG